jgi:DNA mismatch repair protein MutS
MTNTGDLHIEEEILPLFDFTFNLFSGKAVHQLVTQPPGTMEDILYRQQVLKGFIANHEVWKEYSFSRLNLSEIYDFFETFGVGHFFAQNMRWKLRFSEKERNQNKGRLILLLRLFSKIGPEYLEKLDTKLFPPEYASELDLMNRFLIDFNLPHYEKLYAKKKNLKVAQIVELMGIITEKVTNGQAAAFWKRWFLFEAYLSVSKGIVEHGFVFPSFETGTFSIQGVYHPLLKDPVRNDITASRNVILLTGPNMSGKSTFLKAISLCIYLGHTGLAVPASKAVIPFFDHISVAINLTDSIVSGYSHFMSEIITLKNVVEDALQGAKCFAVFDELFRGTNIEDALEISTATIKGLTKFTNSYFFISTHLHQLQALEEIHTGKVATCFIECELKEDTPSFTYKLKPGWSDLKIGRILFEKENLNNMLK